MVHVVAPWVMVLIALASFALLVVIDETHSRLERLLHGHAGGRGPAGGG